MRSKYDEAFDRGHDIEFDEFKFDDPDYRALMVTEENYLEHLRVQAAGMAYYGTLAKKAEREYDALDSKWKARYGEMYATCSEDLAKSMKRYGAKDIEALVRCRYQSEIEKWEKAVDEARERRDAIASYYEGWKAKGFSLNSMTSLVTAGLITPRQPTRPDTPARRMDIQNAHKILAGQ